MSRTAKANDRVVQETHGLNMVVVSSFGHEKVICSGKCENNDFLLSGGTVFICMFFRDVDDHGF